MIELNDERAAIQSTFACIVYLMDRQLCALRVTGRDKWLILDPETSRFVRNKILCSKDQHGKAVTYRQIIELLSAHGHLIASRLLEAQLRSAHVPTHSHAPANWRPPVKPTKTQVPDYMNEHHRKFHDAENQRQRRRKDEPA